jgi:hypothetical protein
MSTALQETIMTTACTDRDLVAGGMAQTVEPARMSCWTRLYNTVIGWQQRRAEWEVARYFAAHGPLSDAIEREILLRLSGRWPSRR